MAGKPKNRERGAQRKHPLYSLWNSMHGRCRNPNNHNYGGRGIAVDPSWGDFWQFVDDMGPRPEGRTIDRIDNDGPYSKANCRWAGGLAQANNTRKSLMLTAHGKTQSASEWGRELGLHRETVRSRLRYGWSVEEACS